MLGLLIIYFIGKWFFNLAKDHGKSKWGFAILGVVVYYGMTFIGGMAIALIAIAAGNESILNLPDVLLGLMGLPIGLLAVWGLHTLLRRNWQNTPKVNDSELLDANEL